jgi:hypothetical protein
VKVAERVALIERVARARAWSSLSASDQEINRQRARALVSELEDSYRDSLAVGWIFVDPDPDTDADEAEVR